MDKQVEYNGYKFSIYEKDGHQIHFIEAIKIPS